jgi:uncharacterized membrane-anchored protein
MKATVLIAAVVGEHSLPTVLGEPPRQLRDRTIVVDGGSSDRTAEVAQAAGAQGVVNWLRKGRAEVELSARSSAAHWRRSKIWGYYEPPLWRCVV